MAFAAISTLFQEPSQDRSAMLRRCTTLLLSPMEKYHNAVHSGVLLPDAHQIAALPLLDRLYNDIVAYYRSPQSKQRRLVAHTPPKRLGVTPISIIQREAVRAAQEARGERGTFHPISDVRGLYLSGPVGCGKTAIADLLFDEIPTRQKTRVQFQSFMTEVHRTIKEIRALPRTKEAEVDIVEEASRRIIAGSEVVFFSDVEVTSLADALLLRRLFNSFYRTGLCAIFCSTTPIDDLYAGGINRISFLPLIQLLKQRCEVHSIRSSMDYRLSERNSYFHPINTATQRQFDELFLSLTRAVKPVGRKIRVFGRDIIVPCAVGRICKIKFADLCAETANCTVEDYDAIARTFHTVFLSHVPKMDPGSPQLVRFDQLLRRLSHYNVKTVFLADFDTNELAVQQVAGVVPSQTSQIAASSEAMYAEEEEGLQLQLVKRLQSMRSRTYLRTQHRPEVVGLHTHRIMMPQISASFASSHER